MQPARRDAERPGDGRTAAQLYAEVPIADPDDADAWHLSGLLAFQQQRLADAVLESIRRAAVLAPDLSEPRINRGNLLLELGQADAAMREYELVLAARPDCVPALAGLGQCLQAMGQWNEAMEAFRLAAGQADSQTRSVADPSRFAANSSGHVSSTKRRLMSNLLYCATLAPDLSRPSVSSLHAAWGATLEETTPEIRHEAGNDPERRLRIGYVSPDFHRHATMQFFLPFLRHHNHRRVEVFCYSENARADEVTQQVSAHAHGWRFTSGQSDEQMVRTGQKIRCTNCLVREAQRP